MKKLVPLDKVYIDQSQIPRAGRGVFARKAIPKGETIEVCPIIELELSDPSNVDEGVFINYVFYFGEGLALALGCGSLYNHSYEPNATYLKNVNDKTIEFKSLYDLAPGDEITVNYNDGDPNDKTTPDVKGVPPAK